MSSNYLIFLNDKHRFATLVQTLSRGFKNPVDVVSKGRKGSSESLHLGATYRQKHGIAVIPLLPCIGPSEFLSNLHSLAGPFRYRILDVLWLLQIHSGTRPGVSGHPCGCLSLIAFGLYSGCNEYAESMIAELPLMFSKDDKEKDS